LDEVAGTQIVEHLDERKKGDALAAARGQMHRPGIVR
jgi:hypothetical protein